MGMNNGVIRRRSSLHGLLSTFHGIRNRGVLIRNNKHSTAGVTTHLNVRDRVIGKHHVASTSALSIIAVICKKLIGGGVITHLRTLNVGTLKLANASVGIVHSRGHPMGSISCNFINSISAISKDLLSSLVCGKIIPIVTPLARSKRNRLLGAGTSAVTKRATGTVTTFFSIALVFYFRGGKILESTRSSRDLVPRLGRARFERCMRSNIVRSNVVPGLRGSFRTVRTKIDEIVVARTATVSKASNAVVRTWGGRVGWVWYCTRRVDVNRVNRLCAR